MSKPATPVKKFKYEKGTVLAEGEVLWTPELDDVLKEGEYAFVLDGTGTPSRAELSADSAPCSQLIV